MDSSDLDTPLPPWNRIPQNRISSNRIVIPENPLMVTKLAGSGKDQYNKFINQSGWRRIFLNLPYWEAMRTHTYQPRERRALPLYDPADTDRFLSGPKGAFTVIQDGILRTIIFQFKIHVIDRCRITLNSTYTNLRAWVISYFPDKATLRAFNWLQNNESTKTYVGT